jgi:DNA-binding response OmpR family regulator
MLGPMKKKIMVVDNEPDIVELTKNILEMGGYAVIPSFGGEDCLKKLEKEKVDLVVLDIMMPGLSGWDVAARIKESPKLKNIPIVFLTVVSDTMSKGIGRMAAKDYIVKPFEKDDLLKRVDALLKPTR